MVTDPRAAAMALGFVSVGILLGTASGLTPGLHVNTLAVLLASIAPHVLGTPHLVGAAMLAAGVVHTFLDIVPALAIGVPDAAMAVSASRDTGSCWAVGGGKPSACRPWVAAALS